MQEVYEELLGQYQHHVLMGPHLKNSLPDWAGLLEETVFDCLSKGEQVMVLVALALYNGDQAAHFSDIFLVDRQNQRRILNALRLRLGKL